MHFLLYLFICLAAWFQFLSVDGSLSFMFTIQDQEVLEARRARDEKDDRLRDALAQVAALKEEMQFLQRLRFLGYLISFTGNLS